MSFRCEACKVAQEPGTRPVMRIVAMRDRVYNTHGGDIPGQEIAREIRVCPKCEGTTSSNPFVQALSAFTPPQFPTS